jgi:hypothetical protein
VQLEFFTARFAFPTVLSTYHGKPRPSSRYSRA